MVVHWWSDLQALASEHPLAQGPQAASGNWQQARYVLLGAFHLGSLWDEVKRGGHINHLALGVELDSEKGEDDGWAKKTLMDSPGLLGTSAWSIYVRLIQLILSEKPLLCAEWGWWSLLHRQRAITRRQSVSVTEETCWWTPLEREAVRLRQEAFREILKQRSPEMKMGIDRWERQRQQLYMQKLLHGRSW